MYLFCNLHKLEISLEAKGAADKSMSCYENNLEKCEYLQPKSRKIRQIMKTEARKRFTINLTLNMTS